MTPGTSVVAVQTRDGVEPEQAPEIREFDVDRPTEATREGRLRSAGKALLLELRAQLVAERVATAVQRARAEDEEPEPRGGADCRETGGGVQQPPPRLAYVRSGRSRTDHL